MIKQYVYISTAVGLSREEVNAILETCARNNAEQDVTGLLLYNGRNFLQLLEGQGERLDRLMSVIETDKRHSGVLVMHKDDVEQRVCPDWAMKLIAISEAIEVRQQRLEEELPATIDPAIRKLVLNFAMLN
ncbi:BLUF domain-containing protein [Erythrobacter sp. SCSIO 43205]|uniref:BLUF domain-containing protein n=1 Tax=Erythrobacter sp. SCSIO 43205 TaxID=2779361 RepID=UPI001CA87CB5|nr:BLUF domain-containing protein [Erythrobacter sp. SCSIO 43205]UAB78475.1 BLUF domain-containing protein [Erythrobacter sp. SCSIO 43205]